MNIQLFFILVIVIHHLWSATILRCSLIKSVKRKRGTDSKSLSCCEYFSSFKKFRNASVYIFDFLSCKQFHDQHIHLNFNDIKITDLHSYRQHGISINDAIDNGYDVENMILRRVLSEIKDPRLWKLPENNTVET